MYVLHVNQDSAEHLIRGIKCASKPGAVRIGLGSTRADVDVLADAVARLAEHGPPWTFHKDGCGDISYPQLDPCR